MNTAEFIPIGPPNASYFPVANRMIKGYPRKSLFYLTPARNSKQKSAKWRTSVHMPVTLFEGPGKRDPRGFRWMFALLDEQTFAVVPMPVDADVGYVLQRQPGSVKSAIPRYYCRVPRFTCKKGFYTYSEESVLIRGFGAMNAIVAKFFAD